VLSDACLPQAKLPDTEWICSTGLPVVLQSAVAFAVVRPTMCIHLWLPKFWHSHHDPVTAVSVQVGTVWLQTANETSAMLLMKHKQTILWTSYICQHSTDTVVRALQHVIRSVTVTAQKSLSSDGDQLVQRVLIACRTVRTISGDTGCSKMCKYRAFIAFFADARLLLTANLLYVGR
jgi:hypothetical protein